MLTALIIIIFVIVGFAIFYICKEYIKKRPKKDEEKNRGVMKNKKNIQNMVANVEGIIVYADGNDTLCNRLVEVKENIRFFNPTDNDKVLAVDAKLASKLDDLKISVAKDNTSEVCFRLLEEVEAFVVQRKKEEQAL